MSGFEGVEVFCLLGILVEVLVLVVLCDGCVVFNCVCCDVLVWIFFE